MIPFMEQQKKKDMAAEEEKRKQALEEKRKQLPELQIVKISDHDIYQVSLQDFKKRPFSQDPNDIIPKKPAKSAPEGPQVEPITSPEAGSPRNSNKNIPRKLNFSTKKFTTISTWTKILHYQIDDDDEYEYEHLIPEVEDESLISAEPQQKRRKIM
jgi:hypothetical protein